MKVLAVVLLATSTAHADCPVTVVTAPDDVRAAIEDWAHREQVCGAPLEIRVVPTEGGYYLYARDLRERSRERIVPDAESAAVLIASWMADDSAPVVVDVRPRVDVDPETGRVRNESERAEAAPPGETRPREHGGIARGPAITFGAKAGYNGFSRVEGVRIEAEIAHVGRWAFGLAGGVSAGSVIGDGAGAADYEDGSIDEIASTDYHALVTVGPTFWFGGWSFRPALGFGFHVTAAHVDMEANTTHVVNEYELSLALARDVGGRWAFVVEPAYSISGPRDLQIDASHAISYRDGAAKDAEVSVMLGLRRGL